MPPYDAAKVPSAAASISSRLSRAIGPGLRTVWRSAAAIGMAMRSRVSQAMARRTTGSSRSTKTIAIRPISAGAISTSGSVARPPTVSRVKTASRAETAQTKKPATARKAMSR